MNRSLPSLCRLYASSSAWKPFLPSLIYTRNLSSKRRHRKHVEPIIIKETKSTKKVINFYKDMTVTELCDALGHPLDDVLEVLTDLDKRNLDLADSNGILDQEHVVQTISAFNYKPKLTIRTGKAKEENEDLVPQPPAPASECRPRPPVVTIMGHVDHGKTTLLDSLRNSHIVQGEFGGITQHIGAFSVALPSGRVTFLDTPGHAAFASMRSRGARVTDIVVLVVAADDGVKEQTVQSIKFALEAGVPIVVAINKCDKPGADVERTQRSLLQHDIVTEQMGGDVQAVAISALYKKNLDALQDAILTQAELLDLKAPQGGLTEGHVIESSQETGLGKVCTVLISRGTLRKGKFLVAGSAWTRVRTMTDENHQEVREAVPGTAVRVSGWKDTLPAPGDLVLEAPSSNSAQKALAYRERIRMDEKADEDWKAIEGTRKEEREKYLAMRKSLLDRGRRYGSTLRLIVHKNNRLTKDTDSTHPKLKIIIRSDVEGTLEAILEVLSTYTSERCELQIVDFGVGPPTSKDIENAAFTGASLYLFNVPLPSALRTEAQSIDVRSFNVVYRLVESLKDQLSASLPKETELVLIGQGHVLKEFVISDRARKKQPIAGILVDWGDFQKNQLFRFSRGNEVYYEGSIESMKCANEVVTNAKTNTEVGVALSDKNIRFATDDSVEVFERKEVAQTIDWFPPGF